MTAQTADHLAGMAGRTKPFLAAFALALILALAAYASAGAQPARASVEGVCTHDVSVHYGPDGRFHKVVFLSDWIRYDGQWMHKVAHYRKDDTGKYFHTWTRSFSRCHPSRA